MTKIFFALASLFFVQGTLANDFGHGGFESSEKPYVEPLTGMEFVPVKSGCFPIGGAATGLYPLEMHIACPGDFFIGKFEVTVGDFRKFAQSTGYRTDIERTPGDKCGVIPAMKRFITPGDSWENPGFPQTDRDPAICISHYDAEAFLLWLSSRSPDNIVFRLPTEEEWEYAARSGGKKYEFSWGDGSISGNVADESFGGKYPAVKNTLKGYDDGHVHTSPVGRYSPNGLGLFDMSGNVEEMTSTPYGGPAFRNNEKPVSGESAGEKVRWFVTRGGAWDEPLSFSKVNHRLVFEEDYSGLCIGFRPVFSRKSLHPHRP